MIIVGSARSDERGKLTGGKPGDQKQTSSTNDRTGELSMQNFYVHPKGWYVLRPASVGTANKIASAMKDACNNKHIGYNQSQRYGIVEEVKKVGAISKIKRDVNADCSATVRACCIEAGFDPGDFNTSTEVAILEKSGRFLKKFEYTPTTAIYNGDVLVTKTKGHTVVVVSGNPRPNKSAKKDIPKLATPTLKLSSTGPEVKLLQKDLNYCGASLKVDGVVGDETVKALKAWQKKNGLKVDGIYGTKSRDKMKILLK